MYKKYPINKLSILYPVSTAIQRNGDKKYVVITSGSYTSGGTTPVVPLMKGGKLVNNGVDKTLGRGGVAVLQNGYIVVGRLKFNDTPSDKPTDIANSIQASFSRNGSKVVDFIGGGALVVEAGKVSSNSDVLSSQKFDQGDGGFNSSQLRGVRTRVAIGTNAGRAELIIIPHVDTLTAANALKSTYGNLVVFDGGNGFWAHDNKGYNSPPTPVGGNSTGFGVI